MHATWSSLSLRWRLTIFYIGLLTALLVVLGLLLDAQLNGFLVDNTAERLIAQARPILARSPDKPKGSEPASKVLARIAKDAERDLNSKDNAALVLDLQGNVIVPEERSPESAVLIVPDLAAWRRAVAGEETRRVLDGPNGRTLVVMVPLRERGEVIGALQLSAPFAAPDALLEFERRLLAILIAAAVVLGTVAGVALTSAAIAPLERVVAASRQLAAGDLSRRVNLPPRGDEIGQLATTFDAMAGKLEAMFANQRQFVADASHELRTPLTALAGSLEVLLLGPEGDPQASQRLLRGLRREVQRLIRLTNDLLMLARLDARPAPRVERVDLGALAHEVVAGLRPLAQERQLLCNGDEPVVVRGDPDQLKRLLLNLVENAIHATRPDGGEIGLSVYTQDGVAHMLVGDDGAGIAPEALPHIFERFYRADQARASGGSGLGLAIAKEIVSAHHGRIQVESEPGRGATFSVLLPVGREREP